MLDLLIPQRSAAILTGISGFSVVEWRLRTKSTLVEEVGLNAILGSNDIQFPFSLQNLEDEVGFELGTKVSSCTRHVFESSMLVVLRISDSLKTVSKSV